MDHQKMHFMYAKAAREGLQNLERSDRLLLEYYRGMSQDDHTQRVKDAASRVADLYQKRADSQEELAEALNEMMQAISPTGDQDNQRLVQQRDNVLKATLKPNGSHRSEQFRNIMHEGSTAIQDFIYMRTRLDEFNDAWEKIVTEPLTMIANSPGNPENQRAAEKALRAQQDRGQQTQASGSCTTTRAPTK